MEVVNLHSIPLTFNWTGRRGKKEKKKMELMSQSDDDDDVCENGAFGFTWYDVGRRFFLSICTHCAAERTNRQKKIVTKDTSLH